MTLKPRNTIPEVTEQPPHTSDPDRDGDAVILCYWCARRHWGFVDEFQGNAPLDDTFFGRLEEVGQVRLTKPHRALIRQALLHYSEPSHFGPTVGKRRRAMRRIASHADGLLREMQNGGNAYTSWAEFHITPPWVKKRGAKWWNQLAATLERMKEEANFSLYMHEVVWKKDDNYRHRPKNHSVIDLVQQCGHVYVDAGGRAKVSNNAGVYRGPYVEFLKFIWNVIPNRMRPPSPNAFARTAIEYFANCDVVLHERSRRPRSKVITGTHRKR
jgi:hypothetical protein